MSNPEIYALGQQCQTCGHTHQGIVAPGSTTGMPPCAACGCSTFLLHPDDVARADDADAADAKDFPGGRVLGGDMAYGLHRVVVGLEDQITESYGWDIEPMLGVLHAVPVTRTPAGQPMMSIAVTPMDLDYAGLSMAGQGNIGMVATVIADMAEQAPSHFDAWRYGAGGINPYATVLGWWATFEAYLRPDDGPRTDELRSLLCVDIDERVHEVIRLRNAGDVADQVAPLHRYEAQAGGAAPPAAQMTCTMPALTNALVRLIRVTRSEAALMDAGKGFRPQNP